VQSKTNIDQKIKEWASILRMQHILVNRTLSLINLGEATVGVDKIECQIGEASKIAIGNLALAAGQSTEMILSLLDTRGFKVRMLFPIARASVETWINAAYILAGGEEMAARAINHAQQKFYRDYDRKFGKGESTMTVRHLPAADEELPEEIREKMAEFTTKKGRPKDWTDHTAPERIEFIREKLGVTCSAGFLGAYGLIYSDASEIVHGSLYGARKFFDGGYKTFKDHDEFNEFTAGHLEGILFSLILSTDNYLHAFGAAHDLKSLLYAADKIFKFFTEKFNTANPSGTKNNSAI
jgi:hypothetical protein